MEETTVPGEDVSKGEKIATTVKFLREVHEKGFQNETTLRSYLLSKHGLSKFEVDEAYRIHREGLEMDMIKQEGQTKERPEEQIKTRNDADRPERNAEGPNENRYNSLSFLLKERKLDGQKLFKEFLQNELNYCKILECLCNEYYKTLITMSNDRRFEMTHQEVEEIFERVPSLFKFHKDSFYANLIQGTNIARTFLRFFKTFGDYVDYMKECTATIKKMRQYTGDKKLHKCLDQIKRKSKRPNDDMIDLLLVPLDRMSDYKEFLDKLLDWADQSQPAAYEVISKATRRFGRLVSYIEKYKLGIFNRSEMNKVQQFLSKQCNIFVPNRRIVRRGVMIRRTTGWAARNKQYIFFLFNDVLLWTTKNGELQNVVMLRECECMETDSKQHRNRKLKVVSVGHKNKVLHLECATERQRNEWFDAIDKSISREKAAVLRQNESPNEEELTPIEDIKPMESFNENTEISDVDSKVMGGIRLGDYENFTSSGSPNTPMSEDQPYDDRYEYSRNFPNGEFKEFEPLDDTVSVISEYSTYDDVKAESALSPFQKLVSTSDSSEKRSDFKIERSRRIESKVSAENSRLMRITEGEKEKDEGEDDASDVSSPLDVQSNKRIQPSHHMKSSIVRHTAPLNNESQKKPTATTKLVNISNITIRLNDFDYR